MATKHYYAMRTPYGDVTDTDNTPVGTVIIFDRKRERDEWVSEHAYDAHTGKARQAKAITEHEARVTMLRQHGRAMCKWHNVGGIAWWTYREYAQYCPTAVMVDDYNSIIGIVD
jgi:hypothetical protein